MSLGRSLVESLHRQNERKDYDLSTQAFTVDKIVMMAKAIEIDANKRLSELEARIYSPPLQLSLA